MTLINCENDWWKWGASSKRKSLSDYPRLKTFLEKKWNKSLDSKIPPPSAVSINDREDRSTFVTGIFKGALPAIEFTIDTTIRLKCALGKSYPDLLSAVDNHTIAIPDAVVYPRSHEDVLIILHILSDNKILAVPFGGGSNVVRSFEIPQHNDKPRVIIDMKNMSSVLELDLINHTAVFQGGIDGPGIEKHLNEKGFTLGHFPQSFQFSTLGGWIATRSAGQESSAYGRIEEMLISVKVATPAGNVEAGNYEGDAEGINLKSLFCGSEGMMGVITEARMRIHPLPENKKWLVAVFSDFGKGLNALQQLVQKDLFPAVVRYSDEHETFFLSLLSSEEASILTKAKKIISDAVLKWKNITEPVLLMVRFDGEPDEAETKRKLAAVIFTRAGGMNIGESLGKKWESSRYGLPYLRDDLVERAILVDTMETALPWNKVNDLRKNLREKLRESEAFGREQGVLLAHVSHVYTTSACIYFTVITKRNHTDPYQQWLEIKNIVTDTIVDFGGAVSHHHSIGTDHKKWYLQKTGMLNREILKSIKRILDPNHILNPGKLFDE